MFEDITVNAGTRSMWPGPCVGGPMHAQDGVSRFPRGFLLVDRARQKVWIYDYVEGQFLVRIEEGVDLIEDPDAPRNRYRAAEEVEFDIRVLDRRW